MAFDSSKFSLALDTIGGGSLRFWFYDSTDPEATLKAPGYFTNVAHFGAQVGDVIIVFASGLSVGGVFIAELSAIDGNGNGTIVVRDNFIQEYGTYANAAAASIPNITSYLRTAGFYTPGDGGAGFYKRVASEPIHTGGGKFRSVDRYLPTGVIDATNGGWWELAPEAWGISVLQFGWQRTTTLVEPDNYQKLLDLQSYLTATVTQYGSLYAGTARVKFPNGIFYLSQTMVLGKTCTIWEGESTYLNNNLNIDGDITLGVGISGQGGAATTLRFASGKSGIVVEGVDTHFDTLTQTMSVIPLTTYTLAGGGSGSSGSIIRGLSIESKGGGTYAALGENGTRGIDIHGAGVTIEHCHFVNFGYAGIACAVGVAGAALQRGNANLTYINFCRCLSNGFAGVVCNYSDSNVILGIHIDAQRNGHFGIWDSGFLGNRWESCHTNNNGVWAMGQRNAPQSSSAMVQHHYAPSVATWTSGVTTYTVYTASVSGVLTSTVKNGANYYLLILKGAGASVNGPVHTEPNPAAVVAEADGYKWLYLANGPTRGTGQWYYCRFGKEVLAKTTEPGSDNTVWSTMGIIINYSYWTSGDYYVVNDTVYTGTSKGIYKVDVIGGGASTVMPSHIVASPGPYPVESDGYSWRYVGASTLPQWISGDTYHHGAAYYCDGLNAPTTFADCYAESGQPPSYLTGLCITEGGGFGTVQAGGTAIKRTVSSSTGLTVNSAYTANTVEDAASPRTTTVTVGSLGNSGITNGDLLKFTDTADLPLVTRMRLNRTTHNIEWNYANGTTSHIITGPLTTSTFAQSAAVPHAFAPTNLFVGGVTNGRLLANATAAQTSGEGARGDIRFNRSASQSTVADGATATGGTGFPTGAQFLGWVTTTGGTYNSTAVERQWGMIRNS